MEAPLRRLAEGYPVSFQWVSFRSRPPLSNFSESALPNQPPTPAPPGSRLWGVSYMLFKYVMNYVHLVDCATRISDYYRLIESNRCIMAEDVVEI
ncbi:hypothetical protein F4779DRAFT_561750 [Xylariaceae sp. FL0662B]|nr:hypothetical protein F4779DRAFT_561750 [Xylariaceae sp. FL0662B]